MGGPLTACRSGWYCGCPRYYCWCWCPWYWGPCLLAWFWAGWVAAGGLLCWLQRAAVLVCLTQECGSGSLRWLDGPALPMPCMQLKGRLSDLQAERQADPLLQDDEALKEAALQVRTGGNNSMAQHAQHRAARQGAGPGKHAGQAEGATAVRASQPQRNRAADLPQLFTPTACVPACHPPVFSPPRRWSSSRQ